MGEQKNPISSIYKAKRKIEKRGEKSFLKKKHEIEAWRGKKKHHSKKKRNLEKERYRETDVARREGWKEEKKQQGKKNTWAS